MCSNVLNSPGIPSLPMIDFSLFSFRPPLDLNQVVCVLPHGLLVKIIYFQRQFQWPINLMRETARLDLLRTSSTSRSPPILYHLRCLELACPALVPFGKSLFFPQPCVRGARQCILSWSRLTPRRLRTLGPSVTSARSLVLLFVFESFGKFVDELYPGLAEEVSRWNPLGSKPENPKSPQTWNPLADLLGSRQYARFLLPPSFSPDGWRSLLSRGRTPASSSSPAPLFLRWRPAQEYLLF